MCLGPHRIHWACPFIRVVRVLGRIYSALVLTLVPGQRGKEHMARQGHRNLNRNTMASICCTMASRTLFLGLLLLNSISLPLPNESNSSAHCPVRYHQHQHHWSSSELGTSSTPTSTATGTINEATVEATTSTATKQVNQGSSMILVTYPTTP